MRYNSIGSSVRHESECWDLESPSGCDIFGLKTFDIFTERKMNAAAHTELVFQMLLYKQKYPCHRQGY